MNKPKVGQVWKFVDEVDGKEQFIFITGIRHEIRAINFYFVDNPDRTSWDYANQFENGHYYKFVSG